MVGREHYFFPDLKEMEDKEIISGFIKQYYIDSQNLPNKIMVRDDFEDRNLMEEVFSQQASRKVIIKVPQKGEKAKLVDMAETKVDTDLWPMPSYVDLLFGI